MLKPSLNLLLHATTGETAIGVTEQQSHVEMRGELVDLVVNCENCRMRRMGALPLKNGLATWAGRRHADESSFERCKHVRDFVGAICLSPARMDKQQNVGVLRKQTGKAIEPAEDRQVRAFGAPRAGVKHPIEIETDDALHVRFANLEENSTDR